MGIKELLQIIGKGECHTVEFKKSTTDITKDVYKLYARKQGTYFINKVFPEWGIEVLRSDLIVHIVIIQAVMLQKW